MRHIDVLPKIRSQEKATNNTNNNTNPSEDQLAAATSRKKKLFNSITRFILVTEPKKTNQLKKKRSLNPVTEQAYSLIIRLRKDVRITRHCKWMPTTQSLQGEKRSSTDDFAIKHFFSFFSAILNSFLPQTLPFRPCFFF